ncbi:uncharacterized protein Dana_GF20129 [Drosophila ananassae]|uniref:Uncharacterized protein n=1 Tax=Drosophila ananassae TaxID=7217 RepID=B3M751_DROAN|nr:uncharacterized protein LOC6502846 [Drosophila ananassae]EDV40916.1 uncharacterized protein Dana_GF20129 [Drosophila ananassae]
MCSWSIFTLILCWGIVLMSSKPLNDSHKTGKINPLNKTEINRILNELKFLEKMANETLYTNGTYLSTSPTLKDIGDDETKDPTTDEESQHPTAEELIDPSKINLEEGEFIEEEDDEEEDEATLDKPTEQIPTMFLKYPYHEPDFKPYPRYAILRNGYVHHMNLNF